MRTTIAKDALRRRMSYQVLARKYRPQRFADVIGQSHVTATLMNALTLGRIAHGYIFSGHRGIGKTTVARILAMALNCRRGVGEELRPSAEPCGTCESCVEVRAGNSVDVIEIDAATNRGIDEIRELRDAARYRPARDQFKIYILDEAHQITDAAFNALLKTLEEPPEHIVFMMATTQPEDIPQTVRSRCQHFSFRAVRFAELVRELRSIADREQIQTTDAALNLIAEAGDGSVRDALSVMDQAIASASATASSDAVLDAAQLREMLGAVSGTVFERMLAAILENRAADLITTANELIDAGTSPSQIARQLVRYLRACTLAKIAGISEDTETLSEILQMSLDEQRRVARSAGSFSEEELTRFLQIMLRTFDDLGYRQEPRLHLELGLLKLVHLRRLLPIEELLSQIPSQAGPSAGPVTRAKAEPPLAEAARSDAPGRLSAAAGAQGVVSSVPSGSDAPRALTKPVIEPPPPVTPVSIPEPTPSTKPGQSTENAVSSGNGSGVTLQAAAESNAAPDSLSNGSSAAEAIDGDPLNDLRAKAIEALFSVKGQTSAAEALADAAWSIDGDTVRAETQLSKRMLDIIVSAEVQNTVRKSLAVSAGRALRFEAVPSTGTAGRTVPAVPRPARAGSAESRAQQHPVVQEAQRLFNAEIRNVIDLSNGK